MTQKLTQPLKWHGGKNYLAGKIIDLMPPRVKNANAPALEDPGWCHYVEPYFGGGAVLLAQDPEGIGEVVNDLNGELTNFWYVLQQPELFQELQRLLSVTPCSQREFKSAAVINGRQVERARLFFIRNRQSRQALGKCFATLAKTRTRKGMNELPSSWLGAIEGLPDVCERLRRVVILDSLDARAVIKQQDGPRTLFYLDPPYMHETRAKSATGAYQHEMSDGEHAALLATLGTIEGRFLLSGYKSELYLTAADAAGWRCVEIEIDNKSSSAKTKEKKFECVWMNY